MQTNNFLQESAQRTEQLKRQKLMKERRDQKTKNAKATRQYIQIGKLVCEYFPSLLDCQSTSDGGKSNELDFLNFVLKLHINNPDIIHRLRDMFQHQDL